MKKQRREDKGITLVALVVTIIVLMILAGVTLNIVLDNDGIINKTKEGAEEYENAQKAEQELLGEIEGYIEYAGKTAPIPEGYTKSQITTEDDVAEGLVIYEIPEGATVNWTDEEDENGKNQSTITLPEETEVKNLQENVNQYVWIPVDDINSMVMCKSNTGDSVCNLVYDDGENGGTLSCTTHPDTATDLVGRLYISTSSVTTDDDGNNIRSYIMDFTQRDQTYDESSYHEPNTVNSDESNSLTIEQLKSDFNAMAKSVAKNGGFYVSRYEVGANGESKKEQRVLTMADSDGDNYLGANTWYGLYNSIRNISANKQMIWGCQYDQVIKFLKEGGEEPDIGHTYITTSRALSGQNKQDCMRNIYDIEGNFFELTAEASSTIGRAVRGSYYYYASNGNFTPASYRNENNPTYSNISCSSRSTLYL